MKTRKRYVIPLTIAGVAAASGVAWAMLTATITVPDIAVGEGLGGGSASCQTSSPTFEVPAPAWDATLGDYAIDSINYSGIDSSCVTLATADLILTITPGNSNTVLATGSDLNMASSSGTINLSQDIPFDIASNARFAFYVRNS